MRPSYTVLLIELYIFSLRDPSGGLVYNTYMKLKFNHVAFTVNDTEESTKWYVDKLGFVVSNVYSNNGMNIVMLSLNDLVIELFSFNENTKPLPEYRSTLDSDLHTVGAKHLCIEVDDLDNFIKDLKGKNVTFASESDTTAFGGKYIFIKDCNNILIEFLQKNI